MSWLRRIWERVCGTRLALLEAENAQLLETNAVLEEELALARRDIRALENSLLTGAGVAPLASVEEVKSKPIQRIRRLSLHQRQRVHEAKTTPKEEGAVNGRN
jgi:hypothetical protein